MNILDKIIRYKIQEINSLKIKYAVSDLESRKNFYKETSSLKKVLLRSNSGIIAEFKRKSPSKNFMKYKPNLESIVSGYEIAGACGISILTDFNFFGGSQIDLIKSRNIFDGPILRKDFILDEYQIIESKSLGADVILLIASILSKEKINAFAKLAKELNLEVLAEIHNKNELDKVLIPNVDMIGVNNRNLRLFQTNIDTSKTIASKIPEDFLKLSESGIENYESVIQLRKYGYRGFLIGGYFMESKDPAKVATQIIKDIKNEN